MRGMGKVDTNTILLIGAAAVGVYLFTRPAVNPYGSQYPIGYNPVLNNQTALQQQQLLYNQQNPAAGIISAGGTALEGLSDLLGNWL